MTSSCALNIVDSIVSCVRAEEVEHAGVVVAYRSDMELLSPALCMVHTSKVEKDCALELENFLLCRLYALEGVLEDLVNLFHCEILSIEGLKTMVRNTASHLIEEVLTLLQCCQQVLIIIDCHS